MQIKDINGFIPTRGFYNSSKWFSLVGDILEPTIKAYYGERELFKYSGNTIDEKIAEIKSQIDCLFMANNFNYEKIADAITAEFNPVWNVESKETLEYDRDNTGTQENEIEHTGTQGTSGTNTGTQGTSGTNTGTQTTAGTNTGTQGTSGTNTGTETTADTSGSLTTNSTTTFDSTNEYETGQSDVQNRGQIQRTDNLAHSETRTDNLAHSETRTDNLSHSETRTDNLAHSETRTDNLKDDATRTDDLHEHYFETKIRGGNIGVTKSSELVEDSILLRLKYNLVNIISKDVASFISYSC